MVQRAIRRDPDTRRRGTVTTRPGGLSAPLSPPVGYYDPSIDAQVGAAGRGLLDLQQDIGTQNVRDTVDYGVQRDAIGRSFDRGVEDLGTQRAGVQRGYDRGVQDENLGYGRGLTDLQTSRSRGDEDYQRSVQMLTRQYGQLAGAQRQAQSRAGVVRGGAMLQAAAKRTENQAIDRQPLDTNYQRFTSDNTLAQGRLGEDHTRILGRLGEDRDTAFAGLDTAGRRLGEDRDLGLGALALEMAPPDASNPFGGRRFQDRTTQVTRAGRENTQFGLDAETQRQYQAAGMNWVPPTTSKPKRRPRLYG